MNNTITEDLPMIIGVSAGTAAAVLCSIFLVHYCYKMYDMRRREAQTILV